MGKGSYRAHLWLRPSWMSSQLLNVAGDFFQSFWLWGTWAGRIWGTDQKAILVMLFIWLLRCFLWWWMKPLAIFQCVWHAQLEGPTLTLLTFTFQAVCSVTSWKEKALTLNINSSNGLVKRILILGISLKRGKSWNQHSSCAAEKLHMNSEIKK